MAFDNKSEIDKLILQAWRMESPDFLCLTDINSKVITINETGLRWIGYKTLEPMIGFSYDRARCKVAEDFALFVSFDEKVLRQNGPLHYLGYYAYTDHWRVIFGKKYPVRNKDNEIISIATTFEDVTNRQFVNLSSYLIRDVKNRFLRQQFCYLFDVERDKYDLTEKEILCIFFLLRGKTAREIGEILHLSKRTVEDYFEKLRIKLTCVNKNELIEQLVYLGFYNALPTSLMITPKTKYY